MPKPRPLSPSQKQNFREPPMTKIKRKTVKPTPTPVSKVVVDQTPALNQLTSASPLADRTLSRAYAVKQAVEDIIARLKTYQDPRAAKDLNDFIEVGLRTSLESMAAIILSLNCPPAYFPATPEERMAKVQADLDTRLKLHVKMAELSNGKRK